jgi:predicted nucleic acid-binding protein
MTYLLDTVAISDGQNARPNEGLANWLEHNRSVRLYTSVICLGEVWRGIMRLSPGARRGRIERWLRDTEGGNSGVLPLPVTPEIAERWGIMVSSLEQIGRTPPWSDSLIAATALVHNLTIVTRNVRDFERCGVLTLNPWT